MIANCPTPEQLESLTLGQLSEEQSDALFFHLESCDSCQTELAQIDSSADSLIVQLKSSASDTEDSLVDGEGCRVAMTRALAALAMVPENAAPGDASIPKTIGDYEIVRPLGHGGMGHVYLGKHTKLNRMVAIKFIADRRRWDQTTRERFESEMRLIGGLKHSHIVSAYDAREVDGLAVLVTEFIDGMTLSEILKRTGTIDVANASQVVGDVCEALQYIQTQGLVHRDIKPSNIMIDTEGNVKLLDLGLARIEQGSEAATEFTATGQAMGTADYIPPEQINDGRNVDIRADIYGLGCTFYKLLTGKAPFAEHSTVFAKMNAHVSETPVSLKTDPRVPAKVAKLVDSMLAKKPEDRPQQPTDAARELETHCTGSDLQDLVVKAQSLPLKTSHEFETTPEQPQTQSGFSSKIPWAAMAAAIAAGLFGFLLGITVAVKKPDGTTAKVEIPAGSTAVVDAEGNIEIRLADSEETARIGKSNVDVQFGTEKEFPSASEALQFQMKRGDFRATRHPSVASAQKKYEYAQDALSKSQATQSKPVGQTPTISAKMNFREDDGGVGLLNTMTFSGTGDHPFFANFSYRIAESSELYKKVERNDKIDIFRVDENSKDEFALHENLIAANVRVYQTKADNQISFSLEDSRKLRALEKSDPKLKNIRFRFHRHESQLLFDRARLNGVWRSVIRKINGEVVGDSKMVTLFHKNELLMCSYGVPNVVEIQVEEGVIECVEDTKKTGDEMKPNATFRYKFLESGRLELLEPRQKMLIRLEKIEAPESKDEKMVFDLLAKATENPDYFQAFIVEPAKASAPESLKVPETEEIVKLVGTPIIDRNHILSVQRTYDERKRFSLAMKLTPEGAARMEHATRNHLRQKMALMIDGQVKIAAIINSVITTGNISLSGDFNKEELEEIAAALVRKLEVPKNQQPGVAKSTPKTASPKPAVSKSRAW